jgi:hypothetical protein
MHPFALNSSNQSKAFRKWIAEGASGADASAGTVRWYPRLDIEKPAVKVTGEFADPGIPWIEVGRKGAGDGNGAI